MSITKFKPVVPQPDFPSMEKETLERWYVSGVVEKYLHKNDKAKKHYTFIDGPMTANNPMGVHHAWGRTYKDMWQRFHNMKGEKQRFQNGFDCQGLWVEVEVEKELGFRFKKDIENYGVDKFVEKCKERVRKYAGIQTEQTKRLGNFMDWDNSYFTMSDENNYMIWHFLKVCWERGWIYKGHDSVPWCPRCETAISQHEMLTEDYKELVHESIYLSFPIVDREKEFLLIWTTTPWTLPANIAVTVDKSIDYSLVEVDNGNKYWVAKDAIPSVFSKDLKTEIKSIVRTVKGKELVGLHYSGPFDSLPAVAKVARESAEKFHVVVETDPLILPISVTDGTGLVHTAVSAGVEDFQLGKKYGLPMIPVIEDNADYMPGFGEFSGLNAKKNPKIILDHLIKRDENGENWVFKIVQYKHRYPACWRCKTELVWKVADEWYISMDKTDPSDSKKRTLREQLVDVAKEVRWIPDFGLERELDWLKNMHDWLISKKNRYWGLALPIYECKNCGHFEVIGGKEELEKRAVTGWEKFSGNSPHKPWIDEVKIACSHCGESMSRTPDVGNPWLDAGIVPFSTMNYVSDKDYWKEWFPADFITESFPGQFKNWFYSLLVMSTVLEKTTPFKTVLGFASLLAEDGRPMHKSWGNSIEFNEGADKIGVDVMRWLYVSHNPADNLLFGYKKADEVRRQFFLILWNVYNFFITYANIDNFDELRSKNEELRINVLDKWLLERLDQVVTETTLGFEDYNPLTITSSVEKFVSDFSLWYIRRSRDRVGPTVEKSVDKVAFYQTCYEVLVTLSKIMAPIAPFMSDEIYRNLTGEESVHLTEWPTLNSKGKMQNEKLIGEMEIVRKICELGNAKRKELGIKVRQPLNEIRIKYEELKITDEGLIQLIKDELNVKSVAFVKNGQDEMEVDVEYDTTITQELEDEGKARGLVRDIQEARKLAGTTMNEMVEVVLPDWPANFEEYIKIQTLASKLVKGEELKVVKSS